MCAEAVNKERLLKVCIIIFGVCQKTAAFHIPIEKYFFYHGDRSVCVSHFSATSSCNFQRQNKNPSSHGKLWRLDAQSLKSQHPKHPLFRCTKEKSLWNTMRLQLSSIDMEESFAENDAVKIKDEEVLEEYRAIQQQINDLSLLDSTIFDNEIRNLIDSEGFSTPEMSTSAKEALAKVFYSTCLIVANTVGASIMVLPNTVAEAGVIIPTVSILVVYFINMITSFYLSDLSIEQYEAGRPASEVPVAFNDIATEAFGEKAGYMLAALSILFNYCILIFGIIRFGMFAETFISGFGMIANIDSNVLSLGYAAVLTATAASFSNVSLSKICSFFVALFGISFAGVVIPGLINADWSTFVTNSGGYIHGNTPHELMNAVMVSLPIIVYIMEIQKIVPSVTKLCNFDRNLSRIAMTVGNFVTMAMYCLFVYVKLGTNGNMDTNTIIFSIFAFAPIIQSAIASSMSISEEFESLLGIFLPKDKNSSSMTSQINHDSTETTVALLTNNLNSDEAKDVNEMTLPKEERFSLPAVLMAIVPPLLIGLKLSAGGEEEVVGALDFAGAYLTPLFIWIFPISLAWKKINERTEDATNEEKGIMLFFTEKISIATVIISSLVVIRLEVIKDFGLEYFS